MRTRTPGAPYPTGGVGYEGLATVTPKATIVEIAIDDILVPDGRRPIDEETVERIIESIREAGLQVQGLPSIEWAPSDAAQRAVLVAGRHRLEAFRRLGWPMIPAAVFDGDAAEAERWRIAENLARMELTVLERAKHIERWAHLRAKKHAQDAQVSVGGRGHHGGTSEAARALGVDRRTVQRAMKVAGLADEAKTVAMRLGLADNQTALISAAGSGGTREQIAALHDYAAKHQPPTPEQRARKSARASATWRQWTDWSDCAAEFLLDNLGKDGSRRLLEMIDKAGPEIGPMLTIGKLRAKLGPAQPCQ